MTATLFSTIQRIVQEEVGRVRTAELAVVQERHPHEGDGDKDNYSCTVELRNSGIVLKQVPVATPRIGTAQLPEVGALVLVQFVGGDVNAPVITGSLYSDEARPPVNQEGEAILHLPLDAGDDEAVRLELRSGDTREVVLKLGAGLSLTLRDDDPVVEVEVDGGKFKLQIDRDGAVTLESGGKLGLKAKEMTVESEGKLEVKGSEIKLEASGNLTLKGAKIDLN
ncbi:MAG TPA: phage baseplate assembly protein V [Longimicrobium sp.]|nr:phage baseplate assembly protein V [Longimicrobium sp.]